MLHVPKTIENKKTKYQCAGNIRIYSVDLVYEQSKRKTQKKLETDMLNSFVFIVSPCHPSITEDIVGISE